ncbi:hypothetical protein M407DRAFT_134095 [Tulasnella calospora MUT 4182]|uniref:Uncharacterized protein n=1 Tax=Tulasnella calospora MUT 4182 TaxID=1051891 RepID=A0A0C3Q8R1_9AGAM|nr:hypothetical protein M407DRAFT_134095 [Tulasnella calospora MUT 4182]
MVRKMVAVGSRIETPGTAETPRRAYPASLSVSIKWTGKSLLYSGIVRFPSTFVRCTFTGKKKEEKVDISHS